MLNPNKQQSQLAASTAVLIEKSGCNVYEAVEVMAEMISAMVGLYAPNTSELRTACLSIGQIITLHAVEYYTRSDLTNTKPKP